MITAKIIRNVDNNDKIYNFTLELNKNKNITYFDFYTDEYLSKEVGANPMLLEQELKRLLLFLTNDKIKIN